MLPTQRPTAGLAVAAAAESRVTMQPRRGLGPYLPSERLLALALELLLVLPVLVVQLQLARRCRGRRRRSRP